MLKDKTDPDGILAKAELEVQESVFEVERAFIHLHDKLTQGSETLDLLMQVKKKPLLLSATALIVGIYIGKTVVQSMQKSLANHTPIV